MQVRIQTALLFSALGAVLGVVVTLMSWFLFGSAEQRSSGVLPACEATTIIKEVMVPAQCAELPEPEASNSRPKTQDNERQSNTAPRNEKEELVEIDSDRGESEAPLPGDTNSQALNGDWMLPPTDESLALDEEDVEFLMDMDMYEQTIELMQDPE